MYAYFEHAVYLVATKDGVQEVPFQPTAHKVADVLDALKAATHIPATMTSPAWLDGSVAADEYVSCTNGLLHIPTRHTV